MPTEDVGPPASLQIDDLGAWRTRLRAVDLLRSIIAIPWDPDVYTDAQKRLVGSFRDALVDMLYIRTGVCLHPIRRANVPSHGIPWWAGRIQLNICPSPTLTVERCVDAVIEQFAAAYLEIGGIERDLQVIQFEITLARVDPEVVTQGRNTPHIDVWWLGPVGG